MKNLVVLLVLAVTANTVWAEEPVYFADENLKAAVEAELGVSDPNASDMLGLTDLVARNSGIVDPNGLQYATNLWYLDLLNNNISDISALSGLTSLTYLELSNNNISDMSTLPSLTSLIPILVN